MNSGFEKLILSHTPAPSTNHWYSETHLRWCLALDSRTPHGESINCTFPFFVPFSSNNQFYWMLDICCSNIINHHWKKQLQSNSYSSSDNPWTPPTRAMRAIDIARRFVIFCIYLSIFASYLHHISIIFMCISSYLARYCIHDISVSYLCYIDLIF